VYLGGVVSYADAVKQAQLGVKPDTLSAHGAVSEATAREMVQGVATRFDAEVAVSVTGIAGPGGGSIEKPVGTVWFAWLVDGVVESERIGFAGDRGQVRDRAAQAALLGLLRRLPL
jgi:nicotinamide-nucleotide amidase